jgi:ABC-2 type transport system permease protein
MGAAFRRDLVTAMSYRVGFLLGMAGSLFNILGVFFLSEAVGPNLSGPVEVYGSDYFGFAVLGVAMTNLMALGLTSIGARIREGQMMGTLELMLLSPNRLGVLFGSSLYSHAQAGVTLVIYLLVATFLGLDLSRANFPMAIVSLLVALVAFNAVGLIAASVVIVIKQGNPVSLVIGAASVLLAGVFYPVSVLPAGLQAIAQLLPMTHALELLRRSLLNGEGIATLWGPFLALVALTAVLLPVGLWACHRAVQIAQTDGTLTQY